MESWGQTTVRGFEDLLKPEVLALSLAVLYTPKVLFSAIMSVTILEGLARGLKCTKIVYLLSGQVYYCFKDITHVFLMS